MEIHLDDQLDSKSLIGTHVCTDIPGRFRWQPGVLTRALRQGLWVIIEDIDMVRLTPDLTCIQNDAFKGLAVRCTRALRPHLVFITLIFDS